MAGGYRYLHDASKYQASAPARQQPAAQFKMSGEMRIVIVYFFRKPLQYSGTSSVLHGRMRTGR
jgi:hypothetical protein